jgi:hypothetical protein
MRKKGNSKWRKEIHRQIKKDRDETLVGHSKQTYLVAKTVALYESTTSARQLLILYKIDGLIPSRAVTTRELQLWRQ